MERCLRGTVFGVYLEAFSVPRREGGQETYVGAFLDQMTSYLEAGIQITNEIVGNASDVLIGDSSMLRKSCER